MNDNSIAILMATYNGETFLQEQIDSVLAQTYENWHLYIHDDGSMDKTPEIINRYAQQHPQRITVLKYPPQGGACKNFMSLLEHVEADYYMFCDQDDIWHRDKIELSMLSMQDMTKKDPGKPIVVHTDLRVVNARGEMIAPSFWNMTGMFPEMFHTFNQRISNVVTGCTMLFNARARKAALAHQPTGQALHDEWVTIRSCAEGGIVIPLHIQPIDYRQHDDNTLGADSCVNRKTTIYYLTAPRQIWRENVDNYRVLRSAGYGSMGTYLFNKIRNMIVYNLKTLKRQ